MRALLNRRTLLSGFLLLTGNRLSLAANRFKTVGELRDVVIGRLRKQHDVKKIQVNNKDPAQFEFQVGDFRLLSDVTNLFNYFGAYPDEDPNPAIDRFIRSSLDAARQRKVTDKDIVAVIRTSDYVDDMKARGTKVLSEPFMDDLMILYMADAPDSLNTLTQDEVAGKTLAQIRDAAFRNVSRWLPKLVKDGDPDSGILYYLEGNPSLTSALLAMDEFWHRVGPRFPGNVLIAIPRRDQLFLFNAEHPKAVERARRLVNATIEDKYALLSERLYIRRNGQIGALLE